ncbi:hypothetical protein MP228_009370 [Amoeboaphelidium protococcarum]|nr:hypothetical protein MP228_009370 [Amoeboaphelidium protococcarum]
MKVALDIAQQMTLKLTSNFRLQRDEPVEVKRHMVKVTRSLWVNDHDQMSVRAMFDSMLDFCKNASIRKVQDSQKCGVSSNKRKRKKRQYSSQVQVDNDVVFDGGAAQVDGVGQTEHQLDVASCPGLVKRQQKDQSLLGQRQLQEQLMILFPEGQPTKIFVEVGLVRTTVM